MGISTPIHDALTEALDALRGLDVSFDRPMDVTSTDTGHDAGGRDDLPAPTVAGDTERIVALAWAEAADRGHGAFGTGHLLLALVRAEGPERELLAEAGATASTVGAAMALVASASLSEPVEEGGDDVPVAGPAVAEVSPPGRATASSAPRACSRRCSRGRGARRRRCSPRSASTPTSSPTRSPAWPSAPSPRPARCPATRAACCPRPGGGRQRRDGGGVTAEA
jgi:hypothetical protein